MKKFIPPLILSFLIISLAYKSNSQNKTKMTGAYWMTRQVGNDGKKDTVLKKEQLKIYTDRYMMYASPRTTDSFGEYGIATYHGKGDKVIENIFYTSSSGEITDSALLKIIRSIKGYRQVIEYNDADGKFVLTEDYETVGKPVRSPLDGAWKQIRYLYIDKSGDTVSNTTRTQFKVYQSGYFIWANPYKDPSSNNFVSSYGYGTFSMLGNNKCQETNINSTYYSILVGKPVQLDIEILSPNSYKQTIGPKNGERSVEIYERMK